MKDPTEELERIRSEYGMNEYGEVNYYGYEYEGYDEEISKITDYIALLEDFERDFLKYLKINLEPVLQMSKYYLTEDDMVQYRASGLLPKLCYAQ